MLADSKDGIVIEPSVDTVSRITWIFNLVLESSNPQIDELQSDEAD